MCVCVREREREEERERERGRERESKLLSFGVRLIQIKLILNIFAYTGKATSRLLTRGE